IDIEKVYEKQEEFEAEIQKVVEQKGLDLFLLMVTDNLNSDSEVLAIGEAENQVENTIKVHLAKNRALLERDDYMIIEIIHQLSVSNWKWNAIEKRGKQLCVLPNGLKYKITQACYFIQYSNQLE